MRVNTFRALNWDAQLNNEKLEEGLESTFEVQFS